MEAIPLQAEARTHFGKGTARKLRQTGHIPALIYRGGNPPTHISIDPDKLRLIFRRSENPNTVLSLEVDGEARLCLLTASQKHPVSRELLHADFYEILADQMVVVEVPVVAEGRAKGMIIGGKLQRIRRTVAVKCLPKDIPARIVVDIRDMDLNEFLTVSQIIAPEGCTTVYDVDFNVFGLAGRRVEASSAGEEEGQ